LKISIFGALFIIIVLICFSESNFIQTGQEFSPTCDKTTIGSFLPTFKLSKHAICGSACRWLVVENVTELGHTQLIATKQTVSK